MPGGSRILDGYIIGNMKELEWLHEHDSAGFNTFRQKICDSAFASLRKANNVDSLLASIVKAQKLPQNLLYAVVIQSIEVAFQHDRYFSLYNQMEHYPLIDPRVQTDQGIYIGGTLHDLNPKKNRATSLIVSSPADHSYRITFSLYVDIHNRTATIIRLMMPTFLLSLLSVLLVVLLFFITLRNWIRQKKLSEMKSDFINSITHEFHTPLAAILVANKTMQNEKIIILLNLFENGIKYNNKEPKEISVITSNDKKGITIHIRDNGIGMTNDIQRHIFEKFYRNIRHVNEQVKGLGLGLYYVKQAIDAHNWKIELDSIEGQGSLFIISIPY